MMSIMQITVCFFLSLAGAKACDSSNWTYLNNSSETCKVIGECIRTDPGCLISKPFICQGDLLCIGTLIQLPDVGIEYTLESENLRSRDNIMPLSSVKTVEASDVYNILPLFTSDGMIKSPVCKDGNLFFQDSEQGVIFRDGAGTFGVFRETTEELSLRGSALDTSFSVLGAANNEDNGRENGSFNDFELNPDSINDFVINTENGNIYFIDPNVIISGTEETYGMGVFSDINGQTTLQIDLDTVPEFAEFGILNGLALSGDNSILYVIFEDISSIHKFSVNPDDGSLTPVDVFSHGFENIEHSPKGLAVIEDKLLVATGEDYIVSISEDGETRLVSFLQQGVSGITNLAFCGGSIYVTANGHIDGEGSTLFELTDHVHSVEDEVNSEEFMTSKVFLIGFALISSMLTVVALRSI